MRAESMNLAERFWLWFAGKTCPHCGNPLELGKETAIHSWDGRYWQCRAILEPRRR